MNATVTLPLSEIDSLRQSVTDKQIEIKNLKDNQKKVVIDIREKYNSYEGYNWYPYDKLSLIEKTKIITNVNLINLDELQKVVEEQYDINKKKEITDLKIVIGDYKKRIEVINEKHLKDIDDLKNKILILEGKKQEEDNLKMVNHLKVQLDKANKESKELLLKLQKLNNRPLFKKNS